MSLCPVCGKVYCDHSPAERGQTYDEMMRQLSDEEQKAFKTGNSQKQIEAAKKHAHDSAW